MLSITTQPAAAASGAYFSDTLPPAENRPICVLKNPKPSTSMTARSLPLKRTVEPAERLEASG